MFQNELFVSLLSLSSSRVSLVIGRALGSEQLTLVSFGGWLPVLCTDHREAHLALLVNVGVVDLGLEGDFRGLKGVLGGENDLNPKRTFVIGWIVLEVNRGFRR